MVEARLAGHSGYLRAVDLDYSGGGLDDVVPGKVGKGNVVDVTRHVLEFEPRCFLVCQFHSQHFSSL